MARARNREGAARTCCRAALAAARPPCSEPCPGIAASRRGRRPAISARRISPTIEAACRIGYTSMSRFAVLDTPISGLKIIERQRLADERGFLSRMFCADELLAAGWSKPVEQINQTLTRRQGAIRGMHFQFPPHAEMKLVNCVRGEVWDVAVDLRRGSPTFLKWFGVALSPENGRALLVPEGFAHGFQVLAPDSELIYLHSCPYMRPARVRFIRRSRGLASNGRLQSLRCRRAIKGIRCCCRRSREFPYELPALLSKTRPRADRSRQFAAVECLSHFRRCCSRRRNIFRCGSWSAKMLAGTDAGFCPG